MKTFSNPLWKPILCLAAALLIAGCVTTETVTIKTVPEGASVSTGGAAAIPSPATQKLEFNTSSTKIEAKAHLDGYQDGSVQIGSAQKEYTIIHARSLLQAPDNGCSRQYFSSGLPQNTPRDQIAIAPPGLEKLPAFDRIEIALQFCSVADFWETNHQDESPGRGPDKAFRNPAPAAAVIPGSPANPGLCSSRAVEVWWPELPATSPSFCAICAPAGRSSSLEAMSPLATIKGAREITVFTYTQKRKEVIFMRLTFWAKHSEL
jgi:hypothetical protein